MGTVLRTACVLAILTLAVGDPWAQASGWNAAGQRLRRTPPSPPKPAPRLLPSRTAR